MRLGRVAAWGGVAGPAVFTAAWVVGSLRQDGAGAAEVQLSGLAADNATDPQIMIAGFLVLGVGTIGLGVALRQVTGRRAAGPWLVMAGGAAAVAAGVFRRDRMLLSGPGFSGESWHNQVHDVVSGIAYVAMIGAPLLLARRLRREREWAVTARTVQALALVSAAGMVVFASGAAGSLEATVQRAAVTLALAAEALLAARLLTLPDELLADAAVDAFAEQVGVAVVAGVLLDHVHQELTQRHRLALGVLADEVEVVVGDELIGEGYFRAPGRPGLVDGRLVGDGAVEVAVRVVRRLVAVALRPLGEADPEPLALDLGHVPDQAEQGQGGRLHRPAGELLGVEPGALELQGEPLAAQELRQGGPLAAQPRSALARVVYGVNEQVGPVLRSGHGV